MILHFGTSICSSKQCLVLVYLSPYFSLSLKLHTHTHTYTQTHTFVYLYSYIKSSFTRGGGGVGQQNQSARGRTKINTTSLLQQLSACHHSCQFDCSLTLRGSTDSHRRTKLQVALICLFIYSLFSLLRQKPRDCEMDCGSRGHLRSPGANLPHWSQRETSWDAGGR